MRGRKAPRRGLDLGGGGECHLDMPAVAFSKGRSMALFGTVPSAHCPNEKTPCASFRRESATPNFLHSPFI